MEQYFDLPTLHKTVKMNHREQIISEISIIEFEFSTVTKWSASLLNPSIIFNHGIR